MSLGPLMERLWNNHNANEIRWASRAFLFLTWSPRWAPCSPTMHLLHPETIAPESFSTEMYCPPQSSCCSRCWAYSREQSKKKKKSLGLWRLHSAILICNLDYKLIYNLQKRGILELTIPLVWEQLSMQSGRQVLYSQIRSKSAPPLSLSFLICQMKWLGETFKTLLALKFVDSTNQKSRRTLGTAGVCVWANLALYCFCSLFWQGAPGAFPDSSPL